MDNVVSALIDPFISTVAHKLSQEVSLIVNFRKEFEFFRDELLSIKCLLADAAEKRNSSNPSSVSNWLDNLEDFVSEAEYQVEKFGAIDNIFTKLISRFPMGKKIKEFRERLQQIEENAQNLNLHRSALDLTAHRQASDADHRYKEKRGRSNALLQESQIVGMDDDIQVITDWISKEDSRNPVIAIVGMGGQGKTLLLQHIFNSEEVQKHFDCQIWLAISEKFIVIELLREVVKQFEQSERVEQFDGNDENLADQLHTKHFENEDDGNDENLADLPNEKELKHLSEEELREKIHKHLDKKSCLFAVDDVWDRDAWEKIGLPFRLQDKVVLTTRDENVAKAIGARDHILYKNSLSKENSWELFCIHAFPAGAHHCPEALDKIAHQIVSKCGGLPLAIKTIGAYLARSKRALPNDWERTSQHLNEAHGMTDRVMPSLKLSYEALPAHLKPCFLYCSVFPKNTEIESEYLVHAWIAQGFVSAQLQEVYDVGCSYLEELIDRCLIEVSEVGGNERLQSCKMHDLLHDLAVSEQTKCLLKPGGQLQMIPEDCQGLRRISMMKNEISTINNGIGCPGLRSLLLSHNDRLTSISASFFDNMRYLSVLDLSHTRIQSLPDSIGNLKLLKYLNISNTKIEKLPDSIGNLKLLKYLNISNTKIEKLPESLSRLRRLQFLDVSHTMVTKLHSGIDKHKDMLHLNFDWTVADCPVGISKLFYLQTLKIVRFTVGNTGNANALQLWDLKGLTHLQHLSLRFNTGGNHQLEDEGTFRGMTKMRTLYVHEWGCCGSLRLPNSMEAMEKLEIVYLSNCVVPKWMFQLQNLMELTLEGPGNSSSADLTGLEKIPHLKKLHLIWNKNQNFIEFPSEFGEAGAFLRLEELVIKDFQFLQKIPSFHEEAMPVLKYVRIINCRPLENMPEGLTELKKLKEVEVKMLVHDVENYEYEKKNGWQRLKERQIKIKVEISNGLC